MGLYLFRGRKDDCISPRLWSLAFEPTLFENFKYLGFHGGWKLFVEVWFCIVKTHCFDCFDSSVEFVNTMVKVFVTIVVVVFVVASGRQIEQGSGRGN